MDINGWLTVIAILSALLGYLIHQELKVFLLKLSKREKGVIIFILLLLIPILLFYRDISEWLLFLNDKPFVYSWGFEPENTAFAILLLLFIYFLVRISTFLPNQKVHSDLIKTYTEILEENPSVFWRIFSKYETTDSVEKNWEEFEDLVFHPTFLESSLIFSNSKVFLSRVTVIKKFHIKKIEIYTQLINDNKIEKFFKLYMLFDGNSNVNENWEAYKHVFLDEKIVNATIERRSEILYGIWPNIDNEQDLQKLFSFFLDNQNSSYYFEVKENWDSDGLLDDNIFLNTIIKDNLRQSIHNGILMVFTDHVLAHLHSEYIKRKASIYNLEHYNPGTKGKGEGFELPLYYHIRFIGLMYASAIENRIDISALSHRYTHMQSIYSRMIEQMINNIIVTKKNEENEYPTNYHWLISKIFEVQGCWLSLFNDENDDGKSDFFKSNSYTSFIPLSMSLCLYELYNGLEEEKITIKFLNQLICDHIFSHYFEFTLNDTMKSSIESRVISGIPQKLLEKIFSYSLDKRFAIHFQNFMNENFGPVNYNDREILLRLLNFIRDNNMINPPTA